MASSIWNIITPSATQNYVRNPSFENNVTDGWTVTTGSMAKVSTFQKFGVSCAEVTAATGVNINAGQVLTAINTQIAVSAWVYIPSTGGVDDCTISIFTSAVKLAETDADTTLTDRWQRVQTTWTAASTASYKLHMISSSAAGIFYLDGVMMEQGRAKATTYIDGSLGGGRWLGVPHNAYSTRLATYPYGGEITNFGSDLSYPIATHQNAGYPDNILNTQPYSTASGSRFQSQRYGERTLRLIATSNDSSTSQAILHQLRQALIRRILPTLTDPETGTQAYKILRYTGADEEKEIHAHFDTGLGLNSVASFQDNNAPIQFISEDPFCYDVGNSAAVLDVNDSQTFNGIARRAVDGWDMPNNTPVSIGGNSQVWSIGYSANDAKVYIAGDFADFDGTAANDYFVAGDTENYSWALVGAQAPDAKVWKVIVGANDDVYIAGEFTGMGVANSDAIAAFNGTNWVSVGGGAMSAGGFIYDMAYKSNGNIIAVGTFTTVRGVAAKRVAEWTGSSWAELGGGVDNGSVYGVSIAPNGDVYICGDFDSVGGSATFEGVARWDGSNWDNLNGGLDTVGRTLIVRDIQVTKDGVVFAGGDVTTANGATTSIGYISRWNGQVWDNMNGGVNGVVRRMLRLKNGELLVAGDFTAKAAGVQQNLPGIAIYTGTDFLPLDIDSLTTPRGLAEIEGELWIGHGTTAAVQTEAATDISYTGTGPAAPTISITRSGGTSVELRSIINATTGKELYFDSYLLLDGETVTLRLDPRRLSLSSSLYGERPDMLLASSDISEFALIAGNDDGAHTNKLLCFAKVSGSPTVTAVATWRNTSVSVD